MIQANELRIGNWITDEFYESFKTTYKVKSIDSYGINLYVDDDGKYPELASHFIHSDYTYDKLFGIPLTEEILLKCGFIFNKYDEDYSLNGITIEGTATDTISRNIKKGDFGIWYLNSYLRELKYLHELQNIFYAITNEELQIEL